MRGAEWVFVGIVLFKTFHSWNACCVNRISCLVLWSIQVSFESSMHDPIWQLGHLISEGPKRSILFMRLSISLMTHRLALDSPGPELSIALLADLNNSLSISHLRVSALLIESWPRCVRWPGREASAKWRCVGRIQLSPRAVLFWLYAWCLRIGCYIVAGHFK